MAQRIDVQAYVDTRIHEAVTTYYADPRAGVMPFYLYFRPGALRFAPELGAPWELADPCAHRGSLAAETLKNAIREIVRRLPFLPEEITQ